jgi:hypothetical protein
VISYREICDQFQFTGTQMFVGFAGGCFWYQLVVTALKQIDVRNHRLFAAFLFNPSLVISQVCLTVLSLLYIFSTVPRNFCRRIGFLVLIFSM